jgi:hypothetical protein
LLVYFFCEESGGEDAPAKECQMFGWRRDGALEESQAMQEEGLFGGRRLGGVRIVFEFTFVFDFWGVLD